MKKRHIGAIVLVLAGVPALAACGGTAGTTEGTTQQVTTEAETTTSGSAETTSAATTASEAKADTANPYSWIGLQDIPKCNYLDIASTGKYYQTLDYYVMGMKTERIEAYDGANSYTESSGTKTYSVNGRAVSLNENAKVYSEMDMSSTYAEGAANVEKAISSGENISGRSFKATGKGAVPILSENGDATEYEYYEYEYPDTAQIGTEMTERFYMKDGDVYAIYQKTKTGDTELEVTQVIKSISGDIPAGTFDIPDLSGYTKA